MSLFSWFKHRPAKPSTASGNTPHPPAAIQAGAVPSPAGASAGAWKNERMERRELLYAVVRNAMIRAGVLSAHYKFKVLSLDPRGHQFLVMIDLAPEYGGQVERLGTVEALITDTARSRHDILVTAVYWRIKDFAAAARAAQSAAVQKAPQTATPSVPAAGARQPGVDAAPAYDPIAEDEVAAFKRALASAGAAAKPTAASQPGVPVHSGPLLSPNRPTGFEDTELVDLDDHAHMLGNTQYGALT
ncbi:hypothetical protein [Extensimonas sp. H3M7-6]|uniref:hypothetical protein n=1 Tax=Extensimonas soli TaxID=3031322 RepID=UPI0023D9FA3F|nr:hypothetical protein [Extensimonas sp. H3M7-6]MDF1481778.1 hypothetical protein [Extensimonas sp. H3M7-6]